MYSLSPQYGENMVLKRNPVQTANEYAENAVQAYKHTHFVLVISLEFGRR